MSKNITKAELIEQLRAAEKRISELELGLISHARRTETIKQFEKEGELAENEMRIVTRSGEERIIIVNTNPLEIGGQAYAITSMQDITERKQAEEKLRENERRLLEAQRIAHIANWEWDLRTGETRWSEENYVIHGLDPNAPTLTPDALLNLAHPDDQERVSAAISQAISEGKPANLEYRVYRPDGSLRVIHATGEVTKFDAEGRPALMLGTNQDITERKQAEEKLRESEEFLRLAYEAANLGVWKNDLVTGAVYFDDRAREHYGFSQNETTLAELTNRIHPDDLPRVGAEIAAATAPTGSGKFATEYRVIHPDGSIHWLDIGVRVTFEGEGEQRHSVVGYGTSLDITERKRADEVIHQSQENFYRAFNSNPAALAITRLGDGKFLIINEAYTTIMGYKPDEVLGRTTAELNIYVQPEEREQLLNQLHEQGNVRNYELLARQKSGETGNLMISMEPITYNNEPCILSTFLDITERKRMEHKLEENERNYRELVQNTNSAIIRWRSDGTITFFNEYAQSFLGYSADEVIGKHVNILLPQTESSGGDLSGLVKEIVAHPEQFINTVNENICKDGRRVWMIWTNKPVYDENGLLKEILAVGSDITERKHIEEELRRSNAELEQFAYIASHDLQEPLRAVAGMVQLLQKRYQGQLDARADEYIGHAVEASARMQSLIQDLLEYSRVDRRGHPIEMVNAETCLKVALKNLGAAIQESHAEVVSDSLPTVHADSTQLTQLFQNLVGNSIKFRRDEDPRVSISATRVNNAWQFSIRDNGIGIEPQYYERIFLVFQRPHTRREYQGTGIGLALCKKIVERHGGSIWVESQPGEGSTFYFTLPIKE